MDENEFVGLTPETMQFQVRIETDIKVIYKLIQNALRNYKKEARGATVIVVQSPLGRILNYSL